MKYTGATFNEPAGMPPFNQDRHLWSGLPWVMTLGLALRISIAIISEKILHPDEIFQYLEQAHRLVFGYGVVPWEYVHGIRNWLLPIILAFPLSILRWLGLNDPHLYIPAIKLLSCSVSLLAIYCNYHIGRQLWSEAVGRVACVLTALWWEMVFLAHKATPEIWGMYLLLAALACLVSQPTDWRAGLFGFCCATVVALRLQYAPAVMVLIALSLSYKWQKKWSGSQLTLAFLGFLSVLLLVGWLDYYTWGGWWLSYSNNYLYNRVYGVSSLWGEQSGWFYLLEMGKASAGLFWIAIAAALLRKSQKQWLILVLIGSLVLPHLLIPHKEYRFITAVIPLCLLLVAGALKDLWDTDPRSNRKNWRQPLVITLCIYPLMGLVTLFLFVKQDYRLQAYLNLNDQPDLVSVLNLTGHWPETGGYYYLHRDVPIYYAEDVEGLVFSQWSSYISHIICSPDQEDIPGFTTETRIGTVEIRTTTVPPTITLPNHNRYPPQGGIDGVYAPRVTPWI